MRNLNQSLKGFAACLWHGLRTRWVYLLIIAGVIGVDQLTKLLAVTCLKPVRSVQLWQGVLHLTYVENRGAAFGMLADHRAVFMVISVIGIVVFFLYLFGKRERIWLFDIGLAMIIGGGIGNMIDRIALGYVVDFVDFALIDFAVFNGADSFVCVGAGLLVLSLLLQLVHEMKHKTPPDGGEAGQPPEGTP